jgi:peptide/nickel transport system permease protein
MTVIAAQPTGGGSALLSRIAHNQWVGFLLRRLLSLVIILIALALATFSMVRLLPGDPARNIAGISATAAQIATINHELGLDEPLSAQLAGYLTNLAHGDLGSSFVTKEPVSQVIQQRIGNSLQLAGASLLLVMLISIPGGMLAGALTREGRHPKGEVGFTAATSIFGSMPEYLMATFLAFVFAVLLRLLPVAGADSPQALILPTLAVSLRPIAVLLRIVRVETLNVLAQDYIRSARSKRLPDRLIYLRHTVPNVVTAALTVGGILFAALIGSSVVVDTVFARPSLGTSLVSAVLARDYPVIQGDVLVLGVVVVVVNAIVDILLAAVDPRTLTGKA